MSVGKYTPVVSYAEDLGDRVIAFLDGSDITPDRVRESADQSLRDGTFDVYDIVRHRSYYEGLVQGLRLAEQRDLLKELGDAWVNSDHKFEWADNGELTGPGGATLDWFSAPHGYIVPQRSASLEYIT